MMKNQLGVTLLESILALAIAAGVTLQVVLMADQVEQSIEISNSYDCAEALRLVNQFPQLSFTDKYSENCQ